MTRRPDHTVKAPAFVEEPRSFEGWPSPDRMLLITRGSIFVAIVAGLWLYFSGFPLPRPVVWILTVATAVAITGVLLLIERLPTEPPQGKVTSRGRR